MLKKDCQKCLQQKSLTEFLKGKQFKDGYRNTCKACARLQWKNWYQANHQSVRERAKKWCKDNPARKKNQWLIAHYGITLNQYTVLQIEQNNLCVICNEKPIKLVVDHNHASGEVRGLLCTQCNSGLGMFKDRIENLERAVEYLKNAIKRKEINSDSTSVASRKFALQAETSPESHPQEPSGE